jgi:hypothetical protein
MAAMHRNIENDNIKVSSIKIPVPVDPSLTARSEGNQKKRFEFHMTTLARSHCRPEVFRAHPVVHSGKCFAAAIVARRNIVFEACQAATIT